MKYVLLIEVCSYQSAPTYNVTAAVHHVSFDTEAEANEAYAILDAKGFGHSQFTRKVTRLYNPTYP